MTNAVSRVVVAVVLLPVVLGLVYLGGWWMFALAVIAASISVHEYWLLARPLAPLAPAGYVGAALALVGAEVGGIGWAVGGLFTTFAIATRSSTSPRPDRDEIACPASAPPQREHCGSP